LSRGGDLKYGGVGLEILALLLLGLIAMLAIVPPIIRGKLDESPLATTQSFQRSMQEMAHSIESHEDQEGEAVAGTPHRHRPYVVPAHHPHRQSAAVRRNRVTLLLSVFAAVWGVATLISGSTWCLVIFAITCSLLALYWVLAMIMPRMSVTHRSERRLEASSRPPRRQAS
jgi:hypothetical protein